MNAKKIRGHNIFSNNQWISKILFKPNPDNKKRSNLQISQSITNIIST